MNKRAEIGVSTAMKNNKVYTHEKLIKSNFKVLSEMIDFERS